MNEITRRNFLKAAGLTSVVLAAPPVFASSGTPRTVVFIELSGGNDGLNTVVPYRDPRYAQLRPNIAIAEQSVLPLGEGFGLHPKLSRLADIWEKGELAVIHGVGYPSPNRSHFRSIEIWETASDADDYATSGWISSVLPPQSVRAMSPAALNLGVDDDGPLAGTTSLAMDDPRRLVTVTKRLHRIRPQTDNPALRHVLETQNELIDAVENIERYAKAGANVSANFGSGPLAKALQSTAALLAAGMPLLAIRIRIGGFDTHINQPQRHQRLLEALDNGVAALRETLMAAGRWDETLIVTYSEFGRRPRENGAAGTDHGTASSQFVLGGAVRGGFHGKPPSLDTLDDNGDLIHTTDFRKVYGTIASKWWRHDAGFLKRFGTLGFV